MAQNSFARAICKSTDFFGVQVDLEGNRAELEAVLRRGRGEEAGVGAGKCELRVRQCA